MESPHELPRFPGVAQAMGLLVLLWLGVLTVGLGIMALSMLLKRGVVDVADPWILNLTNPIAFTLAGWMGWRLSRAPLSDVFPFRPLRLSALAPIVLVCASGLVLLSGVDILLRELPLPAGLGGYMEAVDEMVMAMIVDHPWVTALAVVVMAPVTEELFFRGLLLRGFRLRYGDGKAIVLSSIFFAVAHLTPNQLMPAFVAGLFFAWLAVRTQSLWLPILAHAAMNGVVLAAALADPAAADSSAAPPLWALLVAGPVLAGSLVSLSRVLPSPTRPVASATQFPS